MKTLEWLGIDWDEGPMIQSADLRPYVEAMGILEAKGMAYACDLTRQQIEAAASAPQVGSGEVRFGPELRPPGFNPGQPLRGRGEWADPAEAASRSWRFVVDPGTVEFTDQFAGPQSIDPAQTIGDFAIWTKRGTPAYQLAVVVDDHRQGVTEVVRGDDLLDSAARQIRLYRALGLAPEPRYTHLPLVIGTDGKRLAKRHGDTRVDTYRAAGVPREAVIGLVAHWCGLTATRELMTASTFVERLDLSRIPKQPAVFGPEDDTWLRSHA